MKVHEERKRGKKGKENEIRSLYSSLDHTPGTSKIFKYF